MEPIRITLVHRQPVNVNLRQIVQLAELVVQEKGEGHRDTQGGRYFDGYGKGSCFVGCILEKLGLTLNDLASRNGSSITSIEDNILVFEQEHYNELLQFLVQLQCDSDRTVPWGEALAAAKRSIGWPENFRLTPEPVTATPIKAAAEPTSKLKGMFKTLVGV